MKNNIIDENEKKKLILNSQEYIYHFKDNDINKLKLIGEGTDAKIYKLNNDYLLKVYHKKIIESGEITSDIIKTAKPQTFKNIKQFQSYCVDEDGVRLSYNDIVNFAQKKQMNINHTYLPINPLFINNHFRGCIIKYHRHYLPISYFNFLSEKNKLKIAQKICLKIKELTDNYIYPIDLYNKQSSLKPHKNIIINGHFDPQIIDLDGKSVAYTSTFNKDYYEQTIFGLTTLLLEYVFNQDLEDYYNEFEEYQDYYKDYFTTKNIINKEYVDKLITDDIQLSDVENFIEHKLKK